MQCGAIETKKRSILFLTNFDFLSVEQKYGKWKSVKVFLQDFYRKQVSLSLRWWRFDISFAENKEEKKILNIEWTQIHANLHLKLNMMPQDKAIYLILTIICCSKHCKRKIKWVLKGG